MSKALLVRAALAFVVLLAFPRTAAAFCGFYVSGADGKLFNDATQVTLMRAGTRTVLSMENSYKGPIANFAMVVPVPVVLQKENVKTLPKDIFDRVDKMTAPRLVEYWEEDPCQVQAPGGLASIGGGGMHRGAPMPRSKAADDLGVTVEAKFAVGEYEIVILSAQDAGGLDTWLRREQYKIPDGAAPYLDPYVHAGSKFFVAKVDVTKVKFDNGVATLSPLRFYYDADTFSLPVRLGLMNSAGAQDLIINIFAKNQRYEVANYPNTTIPTNFDVSEAARGQFGAFYASLFDRTLTKIPKAVVTEYSWDATTCDPCPSPPLDMNDLATLGEDVLLTIPGDPNAPAAPSSGRRRTGFRGGSGYTVTRLHARYAKDSLGEDLVFRAAPPIIGGREIRDGKDQLEHGASPSDTNNFQGRYAIRHPWTGPITCKSPHRGIWGGPPNGNAPLATPALGIAFAPRGNLQLTSFVKGALPDVVALPGEPTPLGTPVVQIAPQASAAAMAADASAPDASDLDSGTAVPAQTPPSACGCDVPGADDPAATGSLLASGLLFAAALRRRSKRR